MTAAPKHRLKITDNTIDTTDLATPPPASPVQTSAQGDLRHLAVAGLSENPNNPRAVVPGPALEELVASVRVQGVVQPLLVRPLGEGHQVVAGHRRLAAARAVGLETVPCLVLLLTDQQAEELALVENCQRADLTAFEEGAAYARLVKEHGYSLSLLAERVGKPKSTVAGRLKLASLTGQPLKRLEAGDISASVGELIARLPTPEIQAAALVDLFDEADSNGISLTDMPFVDVRTFLNARFNLKLSGAPFDPKETEYLGPDEQGACGACPKRTGADPDAFADVKGDTCLDAECWGKKAAQAHKLRAAELAAKGQKLLSPKQTEGIFDSYNGGLGYSAKKKYDVASEKVAGEKTWKQLLGDKVPVVVAVDDKGRAHQLVDKAAALEVLKAEDPKAAEKLAAVANPYAASDAKHKKQEEARQRQRAAEERCRQYVAPKAVAVAARATKVDLELLRVLARAFFLRGHATTSQVKALNKAKAVGELAALMVGTAYEGSSYQPTGVDFFPAAAKLAGVDAKRLQAKALKATQGTCWVCGCDEEKACKGGCAWVDQAETLCSSCVLPK